MESANNSLFTNIIESNQLFFSLFGVLGGFVTKHKSQLALTVSSCKIFSALLLLSLFVRISLYFAVVPLIQTELKRGRGGEGEGKVAECLFLSGTLLSLVLSAYRNMLYDGRFVLVSEFLVIMRFAAVFCCCCCFSYHQF